MKKINAKKIIFPAIAALSFGVLSVGTTFALFTDKAETSINLTSGKVDLSTQIQNFKIYSAKYSEQGTFADENGYKYVHEEKTDAFTNGGTANFNNGVISLNRMTPGDKIEFDLLNTDNSNVIHKFRFAYSANDSTLLPSGNGYKLLVQELEIKVDFYDNTNDATPSKTVSLTNALTYQTDWLISSDRNIWANAHVTIAMPMTSGNQFQNLGADLVFNFEAVQGNAYTEGGEGRSLAVAQYLTNEEIVTNVTENAGIKYYDTDLNHKLIAGAADGADLTDVDLVIGNDIYAVTNYAFHGEPLASVTLGNNTKYIGEYGFASESGSGATGTIETLVLNEGLEEIGYRAFKAQSFSEVVLPSTLTKIDGSFYQCSNLASVDIPGTVEELTNGAFGIIANLESVTLHDGLKVIGANAFRGPEGTRNKLTKMIIPSTVTTIGSMAFRDTNIEELIIYSDTLEIAGNAFTNTFPGGVSGATMEVKVKNANVYQYITGKSVYEEPEYTLTKFGVKMHVVYMDVATTPTNLEAKIANGETELFIDGENVRLDQVINAIPNNSASEDKYNVVLTEQSNEPIDSGALNVIHNKNMELELSNNVIQIGSVAGSEGTETQGIRVEKGSALEIKDAVFTIKEGNTDLQMGVHSYDSLILDNVILDFRSSRDCYIGITHENGELVLKNGTSVMINTTNNKGRGGYGNNYAWAINLSGKASYGYTAQTIKIEEDAGTIQGKILIDYNDNANTYADTIKAGMKFYINGGTFLNPRIEVDLKDAVTYQTIEDLGILNIDSEMRSLFNVVAG